MLIGVISAQEFEIDGDLSVTGSVESTTIDSLKEVIENLQSQVNSLQNSGNLQTRTYALPRIEFVFGVPDTLELDLLNITGYDLQSGLVNVYSISNYSVSSGQINIYKWSVQNNVDDKKKYSHGEIIIEGDQNVIWVDSPMSISPGRSFNLSWGDPSSGGFVDIVLSVTADFPSE